MTLIIIAIIVVIFGLRKQSEFLKKWDRISLQIPLFGKYAKLLFLERFTSTMSILLESGLTLVYTLEVAARSVGNSHFEAQVLAARQHVKDGASLSAEMGKLEVFPLLVSEMAKIGEETGSLPEVFKKISDYYQKELITNVERFVSAIEPIMILIMGIIIGSMVIALFLPMFQLTTLGSGI
jgi:type IV pilus assembly protein PilC